MSAFELTKTILKDNANLKAYYRFESGALTTDSSGNSHTLTDISDPALGTGVYGGGVDFDGDDAYSIADHADFKPTGSFTISLWVKTTGTNQIIFQSYSQNTNRAGIAIYLEGGGLVDINSSKNTGTTINVDYQQAASTTTINDGSWHHVVGGWNSSTNLLFIYVDGKFNASTSWVNAPAYAATNYIRIGCNNSTGTNALFFNGSIDDFALFNGTALSADQIKELYEGRYIGEWWPQSGLVGIWHLNGNSTDTSGNNNHGTDTSITYSNANGKFAQGADFDGTNSKITVANSSSLQVGQADSFTLMAWVNTDVNNTQKFIINKQSSTANMFTYNLSMSSTGKPVFEVSKQGVGASTATGNTTMSTGVWYLLAGVSNGSGLTIYLNGASDGTATISFSSATTNTSSLYFGQLYNDTLRWNGRIDEVAIFSRALTAAEIRKWYAWSLGKYL